MQEEKSKLKAVLPNPRKESFVMLVCGRRGSGKTTLVARLLLTKAAFKNKFDKIVLISPTANLTPQWQSFDTSKWDIHTDYSPGIIVDLISSQTRTRLWGERPKVLVILDDMGQQTRKVKKSETDQIDILACNGRHLDISLIQMAQVYTQIVPSVRSNADIIISYAMSSVRDQTAVYMECGCGQFKHFREQFEAITDEKYCFMLVKNAGGRLLYHDCFTEFEMEK